MTGNAVAHLGGAIAIGGLLLLVHRLDGNLAQVERELVAVAHRDIKPSNVLLEEGVTFSRATWVNPPELQAELDQLRARTEYLRIIAQILVAESDTKRVELPRPDPWLAWSAIVVPTERKAAGR